jgi:hypothetical protein
MGKCSIWMAMQMRSYGLVLSRVVCHIAARFHMEVYGLK